MHGSGVIAFYKLQVDFVAPETVAMRMRQVPEVVDKTESTFR